MRLRLDQPFAAVNSSAAAGLPAAHRYTDNRHVVADPLMGAEVHAQVRGLVHVDYLSQKRTLKRSGKWYRGFLSGAGDVR
jgi:hypothetical protein